MLSLFRHELDVMLFESLPKCGSAHPDGVDDVFIAHAHIVYDRLKEHGVRRVITVDPHTTNMLRTVYAEVIDNYNPEVLTCAGVWLPCAPYAWRTSSEQPGGRLRLSTLPNVCSRVLETCQASHFRKLQSDLSLISPRSMILRSRFLGRILKITSVDCPASTSIVISSGSKT